MGFPPYKNIVWYSCGIPVVLHNTTANTTGIMKYHTKSCGTAEVSCGTKNTIGNTTEKNYTTKLPYSSAVVLLWYIVIPQKIPQGVKPHTDSCGTAEVWPVVLMWY